VGFHLSFPRFPKSFHYSSFAFFVWQRCDQHSLERRFLGQDATSSVFHIDSDISCFGSTMFPPIRTHFSRQHIFRMSRSLPAITILWILASSAQGEHTTVDRGCKLTLVDDGAWEQICLSKANCSSLEVDTTAITKNSWKITMDLARCHDRIVAVTGSYVVNGCKGVNVSMPKLERVTVR
jgi:hypothetical protein